MNIIKKLKEQGLTKWKIAKTIEVSWQTVNQWEKETFMPTTEHQKKLDALMESLNGR